MIYARHEGGVVGVRERVPWPVVRAAFLEPVCLVVGCVGSALCEVLRADDELCLLSEQLLEGAVLVRFRFRVGCGVGINCRCWEGERGSACGFGWCSRC